MSRLSKIGGETWDTGPSSRAPRNATLSLIGSNGVGRVRPPAGTARGGRTGSSPEGGTRGASNNGDRSAGAASGPSAAAPQTTSDFFKKTSADQRKMSPRRRLSSGVPPPTGSSRPTGLANGQAAAVLSSQVSQGSTSRLEVTNGPAVNLPFSRTANIASEKKMRQALKSGSKDGFRRNNSAKTVSEHRLHHLRHQNSSTSEENQLSRAEALARTPAAHLAFQEAMRHGKVRPRTLKLMFVGQGRAGKTSTLKALTGQQFSAKEQSTHGLCAALPLVQSGTETFGGSSGSKAPASLDLTSTMVSGWRVLGKPEHEVHASEMNRSYAQYIAERLKNDENLDVLTSPPAPAAAGGGRGAGDSPVSASTGILSPECISEPLSPGSPAPDQLPSTKMPVDLVARLIDGGGLEEVPITLKTWDFGGQQEYYVMHHLFLTNRGIYLVITRLDAWLRTGSLDGPIPEDEEDEAFAPPLEALTFWLSSIHIHAPEALIVIVGTHTDKVVSCHQEAVGRVESEIIQLMEKVPGVERQIVVNEDANLYFFPVDNSGGSADPGIAELRACIDRVAASALADDGSFGAELPLSWIELREKIEDAAEGTDGDHGVMPITCIFVMKLVKVRDMARECGIDSDQELHDCLRFLHNTGTVVFFDEPELREHVVLNPQWLADAMAHVLNCPRVVQGKNSAARRLRERGELEDGLLRRYLWKAHKFREHHDVLLKMLYRFDLIIPLGNSSVGPPVAPTGSSYPAPAAAAWAPTTQAAPVSPPSPSSGGASSTGLQTHVVPCLLPSGAGSAATADCAGVSCGAWESLYFDFHGMLCRLLPTLFPKLVVASTRRADSNIISSLGIFRDSFRLLFMGIELTMDLLPLERPQVVRVRALAAHDEALQDAGPNMLTPTVVRGLLDLVSATLAQHNHLTFTAGTLCEGCHAFGRSRSERYHVVDINELLSEKVPVCRLSGKVVRIPEDSWVAAWRTEVAARCSQQGRVPHLPGLPALFPTLDHMQSHNSSIITECILPDCLGSPSAHTVSTESMHQEPASLPGAVASTYGQSSTERLAPPPQPLYLLYASPLWRSGEVSQDVPPLDVEREVSFLSESAGGRLPIRVELLTAVNLHRLLTTVPDDHRLVLHLSLHCTNSGQELLLEDEQGGGHSLTLQDLQALLDTTGVAERLGLVFLNACSSELAGQIFIQAGAPNVVCCRGAVFDATARCFTRAFYLALCTGSKTIGQAFENAKAAIRLVPQVGLRGEADKYLLLPESSSHNEVLAEILPGCSGVGAAPAAQGADCSFSACWARLPSRVEDFTGRARELWLLLQHLASCRRATLICGEPQVGKSALLVELARYAGALGRRFANRAIHMVLRDGDLPGDEAEQGPIGGVRAFLRMLFLAITDASSRGDVAGAGHGDTTDLEVDVSPESEAQILRGRIMQALLKLESGDQSVLLIIDGLESIAKLPAVYEELRSLMKGILIRTKRVLLAFGSRRADFQALGEHKVVAFPVEPLRPMDAARLFLWRVHRPLEVADISEAAGDAAKGIPVVTNAQNRQLVFSKVAEHPLLVQCRGIPGAVRSVADCVLPQGPTMWELYHQRQGGALANDNGADIDGS